MDTWHKHLELKNRIVIVPGMPRCGTTFLHYHLREHPNIFMAYFKEIDFFGYHYDIGIKQYLKNFKSMPENAVGFDISPGYVADKESIDIVIDRIKKFNPNIKIVLGARNPVDYAVSNYHQLDKYWYGMPPFEEFIKKFELRIGYNRINMDLKNMVFEVLEKYKKSFGKNLLIYNFDLIRKDPLAVLKAIEAFVGLPNYFNKADFKDRIINASAHAEIKLVYYLKAWLKSHRIPKTSNVITDKLNRISQINPFYKINKSKKIQDFQKRHFHYYQIAKQFLKGQEDEFLRLFAVHDIQIGTGEPYYLLPTNRSA
jgi:hypothetical protein